MDIIIINVLETLDILLKGLLSAFGGYAIGRTLVSESIFEGIVEKIKSYCFYKFDPIAGEIQNQNGGVITVDPESNEVTIMSEDGYRVDLPRPLALLLGKIGDLLECETCASTQFALQLFFWSSIVGLISTSVVGLFAAVGACYVLLNRQK